MAFFEEILKTAVTDDKDREALAALAVKYPALISAVDETDTALSNWERWKDQNWDKAAGKTRQQIDAEQRVSALEAVQNFGADMTFDEIKANLVKEGYVVKTDLVNALKDGKDPLNETVRGMVNGSAAGIEFFWRQAGTLPVEYFNEFGKVDPQLNNKLLDAYAKAPSGTDPRTIYDQIVAPEREVRRVAAETERTAKFEAEKVQIAKDTETRVRAELGMAPGQPGMPADQGGGTSSMGPLQRQQAERFSDAEKQVPVSKAPLGSGIVAREGLAWLQEQRASGGVQ